MGWEDPSSNPKRDMEDFLRQVRERGQGLGETVEVNEQLSTLARDDTPMTKVQFDGAMMNLLEGIYTENRSSWTRAQKDARNARNRIARRSRRKNRSR